MSDPIEEYLERLELGLKLTPARRHEIVTELRAHLLAEVAARVGRGEEPERAAQQATAELGEVESLRRAYEWVHAPRDRTVLRGVWAALLLVWGLFGLWASQLGLLVATGQLAVLIGQATKTTDRGYFFSSDSLFALLSLGICQLGMDPWRSLAALILPAGIALLAGYTARRWSWALGIPLPAVVAAFHLAFGDGLTTVAMHPWSLMAGIAIAVGGKAGVALSCRRTAHWRALLLGAGGGSVALAALGWASALAMGIEAANLELALLCAAVVVGLALPVLAVISCRARRLQAAAGR